MYAVYDEKENLVAFHDRKHVAKKYMQRVIEYHPDVYLHLVKIKNKYADFVLEGMDDLYLVRYGKTYVQNGYIVYIQCADDQFDEDEKIARDILYRILAISPNLKEKEIKHTKKVIAMLEKLIDEHQRFTPSKKELDTYKSQYDIYLYNKDLYIDDTSI